METEDIITSKATVSVLELQLPVFATVTFPLGDALKLRFLAGHVFGFGLSGDLRIKAEMNELSNKLSVNLYKKDENGNVPFKRLNVGVAAGIEVLYNHLSLGVVYDAGLSNLNGSSNKSSESFKTGSIRASVGYHF